MSKDYCRFLSCGSGGWVVDAEQWMMMRGRNALGAKRSSGGECSQTRDARVVLMGGDAQELVDGLMRAG